MDMDKNTVTNSEAMPNPIAADEAQLSDETIKKYLNALLQEATESEAAIAIEEEQETLTLTTEDTPVVVAETLTEAFKEEIVPVEPEIAEPTPAEETESQSSFDRFKSEAMAVSDIAADHAAEELGTFKSIPCKEVFQQPNFDCLLFSVANLKLAVPLVSLGSIIRIENKVSHLAGQLDWMLGLYQNASQQHQIRVVDTARWVMPEKYTENMRESYEFILSFNDSPWGLACHELHNAVTFSRDEIRWRGNQSKRPWLAGTVVEQMSALIDLDNLAEMFDAKQTASE